MYEHDDKLFDERVKPALEEMYRIADNYYHQDLAITYEDMCKYARRDDGQGRFPINAFYISMEEYDRILKKATRYIHSWYVRQYDMFKQPQKYARMNLAFENLELMRLSKNEYKKEMKVFERVGYVRLYSRDRQTIHFNIMNISPTSYYKDKWDEKRDEYNNFVKEHIGGYEVGMINKLPKALESVADKRDRVEFWDAYEFYYRFKNKIINPNYDSGND